VRSTASLFHFCTHLQLLIKYSCSLKILIMFIHPIQLFAIAAMFTPGLWVPPPRPPDAPPRSRITTVGYKVIGGLALSQVVWFIPHGNGCARNSICETIHGHDAVLAPSALRRSTTARLPRFPAPMSRPFTSPLLKTTCPVVIIPPRPAPTCHNTNVHPVFEWAPQSPVPSLVIAQRTCSMSSTPILHGDEQTYVQPSIPPYPLPYPTGVIPISRVFLTVVWLASSTVIGHNLAPAWVALVVPANLMVRAAVGTWGWMDAMAGLSRVEQQIFLSVKTFIWFVSVCVMAWFYLVQGVNIYLTAASTLVVGLMINGAVSYKAVTDKTVNVAWRIFTISVSSKLMDIYTVRALMLSNNVPSS
jgi:hypothetical protein